MSNILEHLLFLYDCSSLLFILSSTNSFLLTLTSHIIGRTASFKPTSRHSSNCHDSSVLSSVVSNLISCCLKYYFRLPKIKSGLPLGYANECIGISSNLLNSDIELPISYCTESSFSFFKIGWVIV